MQIVQNLSVTKEFTGKISNISFLPCFLSKVPSLETNPINSIFFMILLVRIGKQGLRWQSEGVVTRKTKKSAERGSHGLEWEPLVREYAKHVPCPKSKPIS